MGILEEIRDSVESAEDVQVDTSFEKAAGTICLKLSAKEEADGPHDKVVGPTTAELESIKELIQFDHEYYKSPLESPVYFVEGRTGVTPLGSATGESKDDVQLQLAGNKSGVKACASPAMVSVVKPDLQKKRKNPEFTEPQDVNQIQMSDAAFESLLADPVKDEPASEDEAGGSSSLSLSEMDISTLTDTLEQLIDLDSLLQGAPHQDDDQSRPSRQAGDDPSCINHFNVEGKPTPSPLPPSATHSCDEDFLMQNSIEVKSDPTPVAPKPEVFMPDSFEAVSGFTSSLGLAASPLGAPSSDDPYDLFSAGVYWDSAGYDSGRSDGGSPRSESSSLLEDSDQLWQESFTELFPSLV